MKSPEAKFVLELIAKEKVVIFSKSQCPFCKLAKEAFGKLSQGYAAVEMDLRDDGDYMLDVLQEITGVRSVPRVFVKGNCVGGGTNVRALYERGELAKLLE